MYSLSLAGIQALPAQPKDAMKEQQEEPEKGQSALRGYGQALRAEFAVSCRLFLRVRVPLLDLGVEESAGLRRRAHRAFPLAGFFIGGLLALVWGVAWQVSHNPWLAAAVVVAVSVFLTGALHEDGLADSADLLGVPPPREAEKIQAVLADPHHGTYGVSALVLSLVLRVVLLASFADRFVDALALLLISETLSRTASAFALCYQSAGDTLGDTLKEAGEEEETQNGLAQAWRPHNEEAMPEFVLLFAVVLVSLASIILCGSLLPAVVAMAFAVGVGAVVWRGLRVLHTPTSAPAEEPAPLAGDGLGALQQAVLIASLFGVALAL